VEGVNLNETRTDLAGQSTGPAEALEAAENQPVEQDAEAAEAPPVCDGLRDRPQNTFPYREGAARCAAAREYRRTIEEFWRTGSVEEKGWDDFAHMINPPDVRGAVWLAYCEACEEIERWQKKQGIAPAEADPSHDLAADEDRSNEISLDESVGDEGEEDGGEGDEDDAADDETEAAQEGADQAKLRALLENEVRARAARAAPDAEISALMAAPAEAARAPVILRGVEFDPYAPAHWTRREPRLPQLDIAPPPDLPAAAGPSRRQ